MRKAAPVLLVVFAACLSSAHPLPAQSAAMGRSSGDGALPRLADPAPITSAEYAARRRALLDSIGDGVLVIFGAPPPVADYLPFAQLPDFRYLTGIMEPGAGYI